MAILWYTLIRTYALEALPRRCRKPQREFAAQFIHELSAKNIPRYTQFANYSQFCSRVQRKWPPAFCCAAELNPSFYRAGDENK
ncbi:hypothetical protein EVAR_13903_1 [Eumeta japonica]|uniref:Uncharacterized protein n=1 Tax=Eumeta variegata TaxID=151549 RepID=A0A4C1U876_EUMVA|nr:hypothetical protein EVAR_13903_1 [Eumeta japonica]